MSLREPFWLFAAVPVLALAGGYVWRQRRRASVTARFCGPELLAAIAPSKGPWRKHLSASAALVSMLALVLGLAGPLVAMRTPVERATIIVCIDVSLSMRATDVAPDRLTAAETAATELIKEVPPSINLGLVAFAQTANAVVPPGKDRAVLQAAIQNLRLGDATATGEAVFAALTEIASMPADGAAEPAPARIVLLSDGYRTFGRSMEAAAAAAVAANVPVSTIALGTDFGTIDLDGESQLVPVDRPALSALADTTGGRFYEAKSNEQLRDVYADLGSSLGYRTEQVEVWGWTAAAGLLFALAGAAVSLLWTSRLA